MYKSCKDVALNVPNAASGAYELTDGRHFCRIGDVPHCGSGGWTLALKIIGSRVSNMMIIYSLLLSSEHPSFQLEVKDDLLTCRFLSSISASAC